MKSEIQKNKNTVTLTVDVPVDELMRYMRRAAKDIGRETEIKGFRKGAAPYDVLERTFGQERILHEAADLAVRETYVRALVENELETVGMPEIRIKMLAAGNPLVFTAVATLMPSVTLGNYERIPVKEMDADVSEEEIEKALKTLQRSRAAYRHVARPAQKGDRVEIDFTTHKQGVAVEGGTSTSHPLVIGEGHFMPGFEDELVGIREGETKKFSLKAPENYYHKELQGADLDFSVTVKNIQEINLPPLNDSFAASLGKFSSVEDLKQSIKEGLLQEKEEREKERRRLEIIEYLIKEARADIPKELIDEEIKKMEREFVSSLERMNVEKDSYLKHLGTTMEEMKKGWDEQAKKRVLAALILRAVAEKEAVHVADAEVDERVGRMLQSVSPEEAENIDIQAVRSHAHASLRNEKVFELLEERAVTK